MSASENWRELRRRVQREKSRNVETSDGMPRINGRLATNRAEREAAAAMAAAYNSVLWMMDRVEEKS